MTIGEILLLWRRRLKMSQADVAKKAGCHRNTIIAIEGGDLSFKLGTLINVCEALGLEMKIDLVERKKEEKGGER